jgi:hypothetical protein
MATRSAARTKARPSQRVTPRPGRKSAARRATAARKLKPAARQRGLDAGQIALDVDHQDICALVARIRQAGGVVIGSYRDPLGGRALVHATLPLKAIQPTPFQRDLSPTHTRRLSEKIDEAGAFLDPLILVLGEDQRRSYQPGALQAAEARRDRASHADRAGADAHDRRGQGLQTRLGVECRPRLGGRRRGIARLIRPTRDCGLRRTPAVRTLKPDRSLGQHGNRHAAHRGAEPEGRFR